MNELLASREGLCSMEFVKLTWGSVVYAKSQKYDVRSGTFSATEYNKVFSGYQPGQVVEQWGRFEAVPALVLRVLRVLRTRTEMVFETLFFFFNHLTWLIARENFIIFKVWICFLSEFQPSSRHFVFITIFTLSVPQCWYPPGWFMWPHIEPYPSLALINNRTPHHFTHFAHFKSTCWEIKVCFIGSGRCIRHVGMAIALPSETTFKCGSASGLKGWKCFYDVCLIGTCVVYSWRVCRPSVSHAWAWIAQSV
jgi:hypothetical protein